MLAILCLYHLGIGLFSCLAPETTLQFASWFYDVHVSEIAPQVVYMLKALGMYALFTGALLVLAIKDPARYRHVILAVAGLLVMRATTRLLFFDTLSEAFAVSLLQNLFNVALLVAQAAVLLWAAQTTPVEEGTQPTPRPLVRPLLPQAALSSASTRVRRPSRKLQTSFASASGLRYGD